MSGAHGRTDLGVRNYEQPRNIMSPAILRGGRRHNKLIPYVSNTTLQLRIHFLYDVYHSIAHC